MLRVVCEAWDSPDPTRKDCVGRTLLSAGFEFDFDFTGPNPIGRPCDGQHDRKPTPTSKLADKNVPRRS